MIDVLPPALFFVIGALFIPLFRGKARAAYLLFIPSLAFLHLMNITEGTSVVVGFLGHELILKRVDKLSMGFGYVFVIMAFIGTVFSLHLRGCAEPVATFLYIGSALGAIFAGDLVSLFVFLEVMALASSYLIWAARTQAAQSAGLRYLLVHLFGGLLLMTGVILHLYETGSIEFGYLGLNGAGSWFIMAGLGLHAAVPPLHAWLPDAYPEATITGAVFLSAYTTKTAVYCLARAFPGTELLVWLGTVMAVYGVLYAVLENDIRRLLAYHIISQVGYMVAGVGMGSLMAINGAVALALTNILYKALLFMGAGAVIQMTGRRKLTELGGVYKTMPLTLILYMIGGFSISAFPLFSGFVSKSMVVTAAAEDHRAIVWLMLTLASSGTFLHTGLKLPYFTFFGEDAGLSAKEPPRPMLWAMGLAAFLCILIGVYPALLYRILPYPVHYVPYTAEHVVTTLQILLFTGLAFFLLLKHLHGERSISLDTDWFYRKGADAFVWFIDHPMARLGNWMGRLFFDHLPSCLAWFSQNPSVALRIGVEMALCRIGRAVGLSRLTWLEKQIEEEKATYPEEIVRPWSIGSNVLWVTLFLLISLLIYYL